MYIDILYHWSPRERREEIMRHGLLPYSEMVDPFPNDDNGTIVVAWPYICAGTTPKIAWFLSGDMDWASEIEEWDLWEIQTSSKDEMHYRSEFGNQLREIRFNNAVPAERVFWVATRTQLEAKEVQ